MLSGPFIYFYESTNEANYSDNINILNAYIEFIETDCEMSNVIKVKYILKKKINILFYFGISLNSE